MLKMDLCQKVNLKPILADRTISRRCCLILHSQEETHNGDDVCINEIWRNMVLLLEGLR